jgi:hypothetical protein
MVTITKENQNKSESDSCLCYATRHQTEQKDWGSSAWDCLMRVSVHKHRRTIILHPANKCASQHLMYIVGSRKCIKHWRGVSFRCVTLVYFKTISKIYYVYSYDTWQNQEMF